MRANASLRGLWRPLRCAPRSCPHRWQRAEQLPGAVCYSWKAPGSKHCTAASGVGRSARFFERLAYHTFNKIAGKAYNNVSRGYEIVLDELDRVAAENAQK